MSSHHLIALREQSGGDDSLNEFFFIEFRQKEINTAFCVNKGEMWLKGLR